MPSHTMELPRQIVVGEKNISDIGNFLNSLKKTKKVSLISGSNVKKIVQKKIEVSLRASKISGFWYLAKTNDQKTIHGIEKKVCHHIQWNCPAKLSSEKKTLVALEIF